MKLILKPGGGDRLKTDLLARLLPPGVEPELPGPFQGPWRAARADRPDAFRKSLLLYPEGPSAARRLLLLGSGKAEELDHERLRRLAALARNQAAQVKAREMVLEWDPATASLSAGASVMALAEGLLLAAYRFQELKAAKGDEENGPGPARAILSVAGPAQIQAAARIGFRRGRAGAEAQNFARRLGDLPASHLTPSLLAREAGALARSKGFRCRVLKETDLARLGMGAFLGVARGSAEPPRLVVIETRPGARRSLCLVGKGLTFDSGGICNKPAEGMPDMRHDMCGAAAVLGFFAGLEGAERLPWNLVGLLGLAENMPDGKAQRPGDVVTALDGTTIEVINTDAEGRLVLADCVAYARKQWKPEAILDVATLTGAVIVALGHEATGLLSTSDALAEALLAAGEACGERCWRLPLWKEYRDLLKGTYADLRNMGSGGRAAGTITAAAFVAHFAGEIPFAHLDIAGTAWGGRSRDYYSGGAEGVGVRLLLRLLEGGEAPWRG